jgi:putative membrane protein
VRTANRAEMADERAEERDATRRTRLANERTYLAWLRSGLTALAVAFAAGRLVPQLSGGARWPSEVLGAGFGLLGVAFVLLSFERQRRVEQALDAGEYAPLEERVTLALTIASVALGAATVLIIVFQS